MENILKLMKSFEERNNISIVLCLHTDMSGEIMSLREDNILLDFVDLAELETILKETKEELYERGLNF